MLYYLHHLTSFFEPLNVFRYVSFRGVAAALTAFLLCLMLGGFVIRRLISLKLGQPIRSREEVHRLSELHGGKKNTPTMGGILIIGAVLISTLLWAQPANLHVQLALFTLLSFGAIGFLDDFLKVTKKKSDGLSGRLKLAGQFAVSGIVGAVLLLHPATRESAQALYVPFLKTPVLVSMGLFALLFYALVMVGSSNAVNLTDGLDGLAAGCTVSAAGAYTVFTYLSGDLRAATYLMLPHHPLNGELSILCCALGGAAAGFLWFNCHPARVFMGDTGSLAIGGTLGLIAILCKQEIILLIVGGIFVIEAMSVILQVASFKLRRKRILLMSPIHHHFELLGWKENTVIVRFWILSGIFALMGLATLKLR